MNLSSDEVRAILGFLTLQQAVALRRVAPRWAEAGRRFREQWRALNALIGAVLGVAAHTRAIHEHLERWDRDPRRAEWEFGWERGLYMNWILLIHGRGAERVEDIPEVVDVEAMPDWQTRCLVEHEGEYIMVRWPGLWVIDGVQYMVNGPGFDYRYPYIYACVPSFILPIPLPDTHMAPYDEECAWCGALMHTPHYFGGPLLCGPCSAHRAAGGSAPSLRSRSQSGGIPAYPFPTMPNLSVVHIGCSCLGAFG